MNASVEEASETPPLLFSQFNFRVRGRTRESTHVRFRDVRIDQTRRCIQSSQPKARVSTLFVYIRTATENMARIKPKMRTTMKAVLIGIREVGVVWSTWPIYFIVLGEKVGLFSSRFTDMIDQRG